MLQGKASSKEEAIRLAGELLVKAGHVEAGYIDKMLERESTLSTYMGGGLAIPHGTKDASELIHSTGLSIVLMPDGVDFGEDEQAFLIVGIAAKGNEHLDILTNLAVMCSDDDNMEGILNASSSKELIQMFEQGLDS